MSPALFIHPNYTPIIAPMLQWQRHLGSAPVSTLGAVCLTYDTVTDSLSSPALAYSRARMAKLQDDDGVWKEAPILIGTTRFDPLPDVRNIMITGGSGFM